MTVLGLHPFNGKNTADSVTPDCFTGRKTQKTYLKWGRAVAEFLKPR